MIVNRALKYFKTLKAVNQYSDEIFLVDTHSDKLKIKINICDNVCFSSQIKTNTRRVQSVARCQLI